jgi:hypothetical protein
MHDLSLYLQLNGARPQEVQQLFIDLGACIDEVKLVSLVRGTRTLTADALLIVDAKEFKLEVCVQRAVHLGDLQVIIQEV